MSKKTPSSADHPAAPLLSAASPILNEGAAIGARIAPDQSPGDTATVRIPVSTGYIWLLIIATLGFFAAVVAPVGLSLSLRVQELAPDNVEYLGYVVGAGAAVGAVVAPLIGMWSDRTRTRFGRRRPFTLGGAIVGFIGLALMAAAPDVLTLGIAWMVSQVGWSAGLVSLLLSQADRLPEEQRGKVAGLAGFTQMLASVIGVGLASAFIGNNFLVFLVPGSLALLGAILFSLFSREADSRDMPMAEKLTAKRALANMLFNPAKHPDFAWNWLARLLFNFGVTFATTFTTLFFASRLGASGQVADIGGTILILSLIGVVTGAGGALLGGFLSDKFKRRRVFVLLSGVFFTVGALMLAFGGSEILILFIGSAFTNVGLGAFASVDQAIVLDVLPERDTEAGRFIGINNYATTLAQAIAPIVGAPLLLIGMSGADKNYGLLFLVAAGFTLVGGAIVVLKVKGTR
jgi:MFS family permease